jgi:hypothetical protein
MRGSKLKALFTRPIWLKTILFLMATVGSGIAQERNWVLSREVTQASAMAHFPLQVGNRWIYETKYLTGDAEKPDVDNWIWEMRITKQVQTPEGLIVFRERKEVQVLQGKPTAGLWTGPYLVTNGSVFEFPERFWDESKQALDEEFIRGLHAGTELPGFFFPMRVGMIWAEREREDKEYEEWTRSRKAPESFYHWVVIAKGGRGHCECMKLPSSAFDLLYLTVGGPSETFFQDGVGVIGEWSRHNGTYMEEFTTLKRFVPASQGAISGSPVPSRPKK